MRGEGFLFSDGREQPGNFYFVLLALPARGKNDTVFAESGKASC